MSQSDNELEEILRLLCILANSENLVIHIETLIQRREREAYKKGYVDGGINALTQASKTTVSDVDEAERRSVEALQDLLRTYKLFFKPSNKKEGTK